MTAGYRGVFRPKEARDADPLNGLPPKVVAHRGASFAEPEHTLDAYEQAIEDGADALECDVRVTADGHLVCVHDRTAERTSDGKGAISALTLEQLQEFDWGSWKERTRNGKPVRFGSGILTFDQLVRLVQAADRPIDLFVETKHPNRYRGRVESVLAQKLADAGLETPSVGKPGAYVMSFALPALGRMTDLAPRLPLVWLQEGVLSPRVRGGRLPAGVTTAGISIGMLRRHPEFVEQQHAAGHQVSVWTVDDEDDVIRCLVNGVDAITTNRPALVREMVNAFWADDID